MVTGAVLLRTVRVTTGSLHNLRTKSSFYRAKDPQHYVGRCEVAPAGKSASRYKAKSRDINHENEIQNSGGAGRGHLDRICRRTNNSYTGSKTTPGLYHCGGGGGSCKTGQPC